MPPRKSLKYLPTSCKRSSKHGPHRGDYHRGFETISTPRTVGIIVNWLSDEPLSYSDSQWLLFTSAICAGDTVRFDELPGTATFSAPNLNIKVSSLERFTEFQRHAVLLPKNPKYSVILLENTPHYTACCIRDA